MNKILNLRRIIALIFVAFLLFVGIKFYYFVQFYQTGQGLLVNRPPSVEGFLPISALLGLRQFLQSGVWDNIHPAGLTILIAIILTAFFFRRFFCSYICPIGTLSDWLHLLGKKLFKKSFQPPKWLDFILGGIKYLLLAFFIFAAFFAMDANSVSAFIHDNYNKVADVKMLHFFLTISGTALGIIVLLMLASLFIPYFWCRYLCPYGALLALLSKFSPSRVNRVSESCIDCKQCDKACPVNLNISTSTTVTDSACISCMACIESCPKAETLKMQFINKNVSVKTFTILALGVFFAIILLAMATGHWYTNISAEEWRNLIPMANYFGH